MYKVNVLYLDGTDQAFYAISSYEYTADGRIVYWEKEGGEIMSVPVHVIKRIIETPD